MRAYNLGTAASCIRVNANLRWTVQPLFNPNYYLRVATLGCWPTRFAYPVSSGFTGDPQGNRTPQILADNEFSFPAESWTIMSYRLVYPVARQPRYRAPVVQCDKSRSIHFEV